MSDTQTVIKPVEKLFAGHPVVRFAQYYGLSNERELARLCPTEFRTSNPWRNYAGRLMNYGGDRDRWIWKSGDPNWQAHQLACFRGIHCGMGQLSWEDMVAVGGWMLSEMLAEVPGHVIPADYKPPQI